LSVANFDVSPPVSEQRATKQNGRPFVGGRPHIETVFISIPIGSGHLARTGLDVPLYARDGSGNLE
jgi:hypothetical protein